MIAEDAKNIARRWVREEGEQIPGFAGAFFHGSTNWLPDDAPVAPTSDLDIMLVLDGPEPERKPGKFIYHDVLLEVSFVQRSDLASPEQVLSVSHMAGSFMAPSVISDPSGRLTVLQRAVTVSYAERKWVQKRCESVVDKIHNNLRSLESPGVFHNQVSAWLFATGLTTHVLLVAGLKNPTVRKRYEAVRDMLHEYGHDDFYPPLLELLGCATMNRDQVAYYMELLTAAFDAACDVIVSPFFFAADITPSTRVVPIDGSWELIRRGDHREAMFWIVATYARCLQVFEKDAPELLEIYTLGFAQIVGGLSITSLADMQRRSEQLMAFMPRLWQMAETIMGENPAIVN